MDSISKTNNLKRLDLGVDLLDPNPENPNRMGDKEFNLLSDNFERTGLTDPILVRPTADGRYRVVGGHHRLEVAKLHGFETVPCTVIDDPDFDEDQERFQLVRMNVIHGKIDPAAFVRLYERLSPKYTDEVMQDAFGFAEENEFRKLIKRTAKSLPKEMQEEFKKAAKEIKTIDGLSQLLNTMFSKYGSTLDTGFMVLDYGGKDSVWVQISSKTYKALLVVGELCREKECTMDDLLGGLVQSIADGKYTPDLSKLPKVVIPEGLEDLPTKENLKAGNG